MMTELRSDEQGWEGGVWAEQRGRESGLDEAEEAGGVLATQHPQIFQSLFILRAVGSTDVL